MLRGAPCFLYFFSVIYFVVCPPCTSGGRLLSRTTLDQGQSLGQVNRQRERAGSPVGRPVDLAGFLGAMGLGEYARILTDNEIDLEAVQLMADSDFQDIGAWFVDCVQQLGIICCLIKLQQKAVKHKLNN